jgi:ATP-dependent helicase/nuclease subunit B
MQTFLSQVAEKLSEKYQDGLGQLCIILPNRRAKLFFKTQLAQLYTKPVWAPDIYSIEDWLTELSGLRACDSLNLTFRFYKVYKELEGENAQEFEEFVKWAQVLLHDFNEIDSYLVDTKQLFDTISEARAMEVWNVDGSAPTEFQKKYMQFWNKLSLYYTAFRDSLLKENLAYQGMIFRHCADSIMSLLQNQEEEKQWKKIIFAGFNALSEAEEKIIRKLLQEGKAEIFWDADDYYLNNPAQEAGKFLRKFIGKDAAGKNREMKTPGEALSWVGSHFATSIKKIEIIGVPQKTAQAKAAGEILNNLDSGINLQDTALVLADEQLLVPVINSLPEKVDKANITMGYPLKNSPFAGLADAILRLQENPVRMNFSGKGFKFYFRDILSLLSHPYMAFIINISEGHLEMFNTISKRIKDENRIFVRPKDLEKLAEKHLAEFDSIRPIFQDWEDKPEVALKCLLDIINLMGQEIEKQHSQNLKLIESEYLFYYAKLTRQCLSLTKEFPEIKNLKSLRVIFSQLLSNQSLPFYGEPLSGLQIMGMLETRVLDFKTIILLSANEGTLPAGKSNNSFIPYEIKRSFNIPTYTEKDAVFAYHFYRLLQRAENIYLLYNTESDSFGSGEKSRFISQLIHELPKINKAVEITERLMVMPMPVNQPEKVSIAKSPEVFEKLEKLCNYGLSPSALNTYNTCPLDFYYKYIAGLREETEVEETVEAASMGTFIHDTLHKMYLPVKGKILKAGDIDIMLKNAEELTKEEFRKKFSEADLSSGKNLLTLNIAINFIKNFLIKEKEHLGRLALENQYITIKSLEEKLEAEFTITVDGKDKQIKIRGTADRIDMAGNTIRLIDYKTGTVQDNDIRLEDISQALDPGKGKSLQLLLYSLLYLDKFPEENNPLNSGIVSFKKLSAGLMKLQVEKRAEITKSDMDGLKINLKELLQGLFEKDTPFEHRKEAEYCAFCNG